ncbi:LacI family DNA-binding transcriptional regulator [uncultured Brachyspira sp.]|uniref:LacI family DNA-binding transcriptional regulator n=1 Tax=uncultured Brachyspira sp. TaxID=221953 RepID=UPI00259AFECA|nr:LacI family DNA-binding transcriptional regulator [uncultured Brachyspira sp.]
MKLREISEMSGISITTISRMLKNPNSVKESTRLKLANALESNGIEEYVNLDYIRKLILIIPNLNNSFYLDLFNGIIYTVQNKNVPFEIYLSNESIEEEIKIFSRIKNDSGVGVIWIPASEKRDNLPYESDTENIIAIVDRDLNFDSIHIKGLSDNFSAAKQATDLLIEGGGKNPIIITGSPDLSNARERRDGFLESIKNHFLEDNINRVYYGNFNDIQSGYNIVKNLLEDKITFDSILAANQILAIGILKALNEANLSIPKDVSIIVFDKLTKMEVEGLQISEVTFPAFDIGANTSKVLLEQKSPASLKQIYNYSGRFYLRGSENKE